MELIKMLENIVAKIIANDKNKKNYSVGNFEKDLFYSHFLKNTLQRDIISLDKIYSPKEIVLDDWTNNSSQKFNLNNLDNYIFRENKNKNLNLNLPSPEELISSIKYLTLFDNNKIKNQVKKLSSVSELRQLLVLDEIYSNLKSRRHEKINFNQHFHMVINNSITSYKNQQHAEKMQAEISSFGTLLDRMDYSIDLNKIKEIEKSSKTIKSYLRIDSDDFEIKEEIENSKEQLGRFNVSVNKWIDVKYKIGFRNIESTINIINKKKFLDKNDMDSLDIARNKLLNLEDILLYRKDSRIDSLDELKLSREKILEKHDHFLKNKDSFRNYLISQKKDIDIFLKREYTLNNLKKLFSKNNVNHEIFKNKYIQNYLKESLDNKFFVDYYGFPENNKEASSLCFIDSLYTNLNENRKPDEKIISKKGKALVYLFNQYKWQKKSGEIERKLELLQEFFNKKDGVFSTSDLEDIEIKSSEVRDILKIKSSDLEVNKNINSLKKYLLFIKKKTYENIENQYEGIFVYGNKELEKIKSMPMISEKEISFIDNLKNDTLRLNEIFIKKKDARKEKILPIFSQIGKLNSDYSHFKKNVNKYDLAFSSLNNLDSSLNSIVNSSSFNYKKAKILINTTENISHLEYFLKYSSNERNKYLNNYFDFKNYNFNSSLNAIKWKIPSVCKKVINLAKNAKNKIPKKKNWFNAGICDMKQKEYELLNNFNEKISRFIEKV